VVLDRVGSGLRERKKQRTRQALIEAAMRLYRDAGYEAVTVAAIAREADVAPRTFFGYFESKEDVVLSRGDDRLELLVQAIRQRDRQQPILAAVRPVLLQNREPGHRGQASNTPGLGELLQQPAVRARLRERWNRWEDTLAVAIAQDVGAKPEGPEPRVVAAAITGAIRIAAITAQEHQGQRKEIAERAFKLLASGLSRYGVGLGKRAARPRTSNSAGTKLAGLGPGA